jgi:hypothetical protein
VWASLRRQDVSDATGHFPLTGGNSNWYSSTIWLLLNTHTHTHTHTHNQTHTNTQTHAPNPLVAGASSRIQLPVHISEELPVLYSCQCISRRSFQSYTAASACLWGASSLIQLPVHVSGELPVLYSCQCMSLGSFQSYTVASACLWGAFSLIQLPVHVSEELSVLYSCQYNPFRVRSRQSRWLNVKMGLMFLPLRHAGSSGTVRLEYEMERNEKLENRSCVALSNNKFLNLLLKWMDT